jgi:hypothetical protein
MMFMTPQNNALIMTYATDADALSGGKPSVRILRAM